MQQPTLSLTYTQWCAEALPFLLDNHGCRPATWLSLFPHLSLAACALPALVPDQHDHQPKWAHVALRTAPCCGTARCTPLSCTASRRPPPPAGTAACWQCRRQECGSSLAHCNGDAFMNCTHTAQVAKFDIKKGACKAACVVNVVGTFPSIQFIWYLQKAWLFNSQLDSAIANLIPLQVGVNYSSVSLPSMLSLLWGLDIGAQFL